MEASSTLTSAASPATITPAPTYYRPEPWPPVFLLGARPLSVDGHIFTQDERSEGGYRFRIDCPTANVSTDYRMPEDDAGDEECRRADLFPAEVYHDVDQFYNGPNAWGGTFTPSAAPARTWRCEMPPYFLDFLATAARSLSAGNCSQWESATGGGAFATAATTTATLDRCAMLRGRVPLRLTGAGREGQWQDLSMGSGLAGYPLDPDSFNEWVAEALSSLGCPDPTSLLGFGVAEATATSDSSSGTSSASAASAGMTFRSGRAGLVAVVCVVLACAIVVTELL